MTKIKPPSKLMKTDKQFRQDAYELHGDDIVYLEEYKGSHTKLWMQCEICEHVFQKSPTKLLHGKQGCPMCSKRLTCEKMTKYTHDDFVRLLYNVHGDKLTCISAYNKTTERVTLECNVCSHVYDVLFANCIHKRSGCPSCTGRMLKTHDTFVTESRAVHDEDYEYIETYKGIDTPINIKCRNCGTTFKQSPHNHIHGRNGCRQCSSSRRTKKLKQYLNEYGIKSTSEKTYPDLKDIASLRYDFYLPKYNAVIEYDGIQHFKPVKYWRGIEGMLDTQRKDIIKDIYANENGIHLFRIKYTIKDLRQTVLKIIKTLEKYNHNDDTLFVRYEE